MYNVLSNAVFFLVAWVLMIGWIVSVFFFSVNGFIHLVLAAAVVSMFLGIVRRD
jgi:hypothetical protein